MIAVVPSRDSATEAPWPAAPTAPVPTNFFACGVHVPLLKVNAQAAPVLALSVGAPNSKVLPRLFNATEKPCPGLLRGAGVPASMVPPEGPRYMTGGPGNPLGARAMYLGGTIYRIHGTNAPDTIGTRVSSGCIRLSP
jgi:hypothetical protein